MQQSSNTARTLAQSSGFEQTETAGSSISEHPAATSGGGWYQEGLYRDKAAREASMSAICGKLDTKSIIYWLKRTVQEIRWMDRKQPFERVFVWMPEPEASLQTQAETWTVHLRLLQVLKESAWTLKPAKSLKNKQTEKYEDFQLSQRTIRTNRDESETSQKTNGLMDVNNSPINATGGRKSRLADQNRYLTIFIHATCVSDMKNEFLL